MQTRTLMAKIKEGMAVIDRDGHTVGHVKHLYMGDTDPDTPEIEAVRATPTQSDYADGFMVQFAQAIAPGPDIPDELVNRMRRAGYIRIDTGPLGLERCYALSDEVVQVTDEEVHLNVSDEALIRF